MNNILKTEEDYKREVLDLYDYINSICKAESDLHVVLSCSAAAAACIEKIKVYRISNMAEDLVFIGEYRGENCD